MVLTNKPHRSGNRGRSGNQLSPGHEKISQVSAQRRNFLRSIFYAGIATVGSGTASAASTFPEKIPLPTGFQPEGIVTGRGHEFFVGSLSSGAIYRGDFRSGEGQLLVSPSIDRVAVGLSYDRRSDSLFVAGRSTGNAFVYDATTGDTEKIYQFTTEDNFVNDVVVTSTAAYFTDSFRPFLYRVPLGAAGRLPDQLDVDEIALNNFQMVPGEFNANGIDSSPNDNYLIVVNSTTGILYRVDPISGNADEVDLGGEVLTAGDGVLLDGRTLYVVRNRLNVVVEIRLDHAAAEGEIVREITDSRFDVPTTITDFGNAIYAVNARFGIDSPEDAEYHVIRKSK